jgi:hypothetical protein
MNLAVGIIPIPLAEISAAKLVEPVNNDKWPLVVSRCA